MNNPFFKNTGPYDINKLLKLINLQNDNFPENKINDIKDLFSSEIGDITFFHSKKYSEIAKNTKASYCITTESLSGVLPKSCKTYCCVALYKYTQSLLQAMEVNSNMATLTVK